MCEAEFAAHVLETNHELDNVIDDALDGEHLQHVGFPDLHFPNTNESPFPNFNHEREGICCPLPDIVNTIEVFWLADDQFYSGVSGEMTDGRKIY